MATIDTRTLGIDILNVLAETLPKLKMDEEHNAGVMMGALTTLAVMTERRANCLPCSDRELVKPGVNAREAADSGDLGCLTPEGMGAAKRLEELRSTMNGLVAEAAIRRLGDLLSKAVAQPPTTSTPTPDDDSIYIVSGTPDDTNPGN